MGSTFCWVSWSASQPAFQILVEGAAARGTGRVVQNLKQSGRRAKKANGNDSVARAVGGGLAGAVLALFMMTATAISLLSAPRKSSPRVLQALRFAPRAPASASQHPPSRARWAVRNCAVGAAGRAQRKRIGRPLKAPPLIVVPGGSMREAARM